MGRQWHFEQDEQEKWFWKREDTDEGTFGSAITFENQTDCMLAAVRFAVQRRRAQIDCGREDLLQ